MCPRIERDFTESKRQTIPVETKTTTALDAERDCELHDLQREKSRYASNASVHAVDLAASGQAAAGSGRCRSAGRRQPVPEPGEVGAQPVGFARHPVGRGLDARDMPAVRAIMREAAGRDYRFQSLVLGIVHSTPFTMRQSSVRLQAD